MSCESALFFLSGEMSKTAYPVLFANVQMFLNKMGYGQSGHQSTFVHFKKEPDAAIHASGATSHWPPVITIAEPGCIADGFVGLVYDRNYVMDLFIPPSVFGPPYRNCESGASGIETEPTSR